LCSAKCKRKNSTADIDYGIEWYKAGQTAGFSIFVRRFGLTLECGTPAPLCLAVHWFYPASGAIQFQSGAGSPQSKDAPQSQNIKSCFIALFELIVTVPVDKITICKKREVRRQEPGVRMGTGKIRSN
jgi:hypothetical protein